MGFMRGGLRWLGLAVVLLGAAEARACMIPVFRYALERWAASPYEVVVFHRGELEQVDREALEEFAKMPANLVIRLVDLGAGAAAEDEALWKHQGGRAANELPWAVVRYPESGDKAPVVWAGKVQKTRLIEQVDSPARRELSRRLMAGDSCVWVVLGSADQEKDQRVAAELEAELKRLEKSLKLPEIAPDGPQLNSPLPLKIRFSVLRVARDDPRETALVRMLKVAEPDLAQSDDTLVIPVIGRGRAVSALAGSRINGARIGAFAEFVCGQCSCEVKELNPGIDLLVAADWDAIFGERPDALELEGGGGVAGGQSVPIPTSPVASASASSSIVMMTTSLEIRREWIWAAILVVMVLAVVSGAAVLKARRR
jgi:hypothetical protein